MIVRLVSDHPDKAKPDQISVLTLNLLTGETEELLYDRKLDEFPWTKLRRM